MIPSSEPRSRLYEIRVDAHLDDRWAASFDGMSLVRQPDGTTLLRGELPDQAALHGVLSRLRDAGMSLASVVSPSGEPGTHMRAAVYHRFGGPEVVGLETAPRPEPGPGQLLIRVHATTVSAADYRARSRDIPAGLTLPSSFVLGFFRPRRPVLGMDAAGVVVAVGAGETRFAPGDEVVAMLGGRFGGHAEYAIIGAADAVAAKPRSMSFEDAVALVFGGITARAFLRQADIRPGSRVLVNGASGAVGTAAVQLARDLGAHVTAVSRAANRGLVTSLGAERVIDYQAQDFTTGPERYDVIVDCVGTATFARVRDRLAPKGALLLVVTTLASLLAAPRQARRAGVSIVTGPGPFRSDDLAHVMSLAQTGALRPVIERSFPFDQIADAHRLVDTGRKRGSVVVSIPAA
ncbi:MAG: NAD(P)-dependent alcohol dehydrogenase [Protaetiibacter sp.]